MCCPSGQMDKASVSGAEDCGFESHLGCHCLLLRASRFLDSGRYAASSAASSGACSVMVIIGASQALDPGSIPGRRRPGALAQSEECVLCKHEVRGSKPRCSILPIGRSDFFSRRQNFLSGFRLGWPSGPRRSTQVRVSPGGVGSNPTPSILNFFIFCFQKYFC